MGILSVDPCLTIPPQWIAARPRTARHRKETNRQEHRWEHWKSSTGSELVHSELDYLRQCEQDTPEMIEHRNANGRTAMEMACVHVACVAAAETCKHRVARARMMAVSSLLLPW